MILNLDRLPRVIPVGIQSESGVEEIGFDISPWLTRWPEMKITVWPTRPGESAAYIAEDTEMVGNVMYWYPNTADTEKEGAGTVEVVGIGGGKRKSSGVIDTLVKKTSLDVTQETPDPFTPWYEAILKAVEDVYADLEAVRAEIPGILLVKIGSGNISSHTQQEVKDAYYKGKTGKAVLMVDPMGRVFTMTRVKDGVPIFHHTSATRLPADAPSANALLVYEARLNADGTFSVASPNYSTTPNPYPIKLTGAVNATYDGSSAVTVEIPQGGSGGGSTSKDVTILSATTLTPADPDAGTYVLLSPFETKPEGGMLCTVTYNGVDYQCPAGVFDKGQGAVVAMGNFALIGQEGGNTEAPFVLMCAPDGTEGMYAMMMVTGSPSGVTVSITAKVVDEAIKAYVDGKVSDAISAIPEPTTDVLTVTADMSNLEVSNVSHTYDEIDEAIKAGKAVQMVVSQGENGQTIVAPLIIWNESGNNRMLVFQTMALGEEGEAKGAVITITYNDRTGTITAAFIDLDIAPPKKGVDYWTDADKAEIIADVIDALDAAEGVNF